MSLAFLEADLSIEETSPTMFSTSAGEHVDQTKSNKETHLGPWELSWMDLYHRYHHLAV
jgi:hypothetical protein